MAVGLNKLLLFALVFILLFSVAGAFLNFTQNPFEDKPYFKEVGRWYTILFDFLRAVVTFIAILLAVFLFLFA